MELDDTAAILARSDFFDLCDREQLKLLAFASERRHVTIGDVVFSEGDPSDGAYILVSGRIAAEGTDHTPFTISEPGTILGHMGLILNKPRHATLRAASSAELIFVPRNAFSKILHQYPETAAALRERLSEELSGYVDAVSFFRG